VVKKSEQALIASQLDKIGRFSGAVTKKYKNSKFCQCFGQDRFTKSVL